MLAVSLSQVNMLAGEPWRIGRRDHPCKFFFCPCKQTSGKPFMINMSSDRTLYQEIQQCLQDAAVSADHRGPTCVNDVDDKFIMVWAFAVAQWV